jgi:hypothetical protein
MSTKSQPDHSEIMFALGAMHSDVKSLKEDVAELKAGSTARMDGHSRRIGSLETTRVRLVGYAAGMSAGIFTVGTFLKDKILS